MKASEWLKENGATLIWILLIGGGLIWWWASSQHSTTANQTPVDLSVTQARAPTASDFDANGCYTADKASVHEGESACVDFNVGYTYESRAGNKFIDEYSDYSSGFSVYIPSSSSASDLGLSQFNGKNIKVSGTIINYEGGPEIIVTDSSEIIIYN